MLGADAHKWVFAHYDIRLLTRPKIPKNPKILNFVLECPKMEKLS